MGFSDISKLLFLSAIWGGSFLFMRIAAPEMGPFVLIWLRVTLAALVLSPILFRKSVRQEIRNNLKQIILVGIFNAVFPWCLLAYAVLHLEAGFTSLLNASTPIFAAMVGFLWLKQPLNSWKVLGLLLGIIGVAILAGSRFSISSGTGLAIGATLVASFSYGYIGHYVNRKLNGVSAWALTIGCLSVASVILLGPMLMTLPDAKPSGLAIFCALALGILSTAIAFILLYDLLNRAGATATSTVTFVIPIFGILFGAVFLNEKVSPQMMIGMAVALSGAALVTGLLPGKLAK